MTKKIKEVDELKQFVDKEVEGLKARVIQKCKDFGKDCSDSFEEKPTYIMCQVFEIKKQKNVDIDSEDENN